jgi:hypothetical protein
LRLRREDESQFAEIGVAESIGRDPVFAPEDQAD